MYYKMLTYSFAARLVTYSVAYQHRFRPVLKKLNGKYCFRIKESNSSNRTFKYV